MVWAREDHSLFGRTARERWAFALAFVVLAVFSEVWVKPFNGDATVPADSALLRLLYFPGYLAGLALVALGPWRVLDAMARTALVWALIALAFLSAHWSINAGVTHRRVLALFLSSLAGLAVAAQLDWRRMTLALAGLFALIALGSLFTAALVPSYGRMKLDFPGAWDGLFIEKNGLGAAGAQTLIFCAAAFRLDRPRRWLWAGAALLGAGLLVMSTSKTSLVVALLGCLAFAFAWGVRRGPAMAVMTTFCGAVGVGLAAFLVAFMPTALLGLMGKDATLTGRTRIWAAVMRQVDTRPLTGFGYGAVWSDKTGWGPAYWVVKQYGARPAYAHNGWVDLWLGIGVFGVVLFAALLVLTWLSTLAVTYRNTRACVALPYLAMFTLNNCTESSILWYNSIAWVVFVMLAAKVMIGDAVPLRAAPTKPSLVPFGIDLPDRPSAPQAA